MLFGVTPTGTSSALIGAALTGLITLAFPGKPPAAEPHRDIARRMTAEPLRRWLYHLWPALALGLIAGFVIVPPAGGWNPTHVMFQAAFLPFLMPLHPSEGRLLARAQDRIRLCGILLLGAGVWVGTS